MFKHFGLLACIAVVACAAASPATAAEPRDSVQVVDSAPPRVHPRRMVPVVYLAAMAAGTQLGRLDHDAGGYDRQRFYLSKFIAHGTAGFTLESLAERAHVAPWLALAGTCAGAIGYEYAQGYPNRRDMANGCGGALVSYLYGRIWR